MKKEGIARTDVRGGECTKEEKSFLIAAWLVQ